MQPGRESQNKNHWNTYCRDQCSSVNSSTLRCSFSASYILPILSSDCKENINGKLLPRIAFCHKNKEIKLERCTNRLCENFFLHLQKLNDLLVFRSLLNQSSVVFLHSETLHERQVREKCDVWSETFCCPHGLCTNYCLVDPNYPVTLQLSFVL